MSAQSRAVARQPAVDGEFACREDRRQPALVGQRQDAGAAVDQKGVGTDGAGIDRAGRQRLEGALDRRAAGRGQELDLEAERGGSLAGCAAGARRSPDCRGSSARPRCAPVGNMSCSRSSRLASSSLAHKVMPVRLPSGRLRLVDQPDLHRIGAGAEHDGDGRGRGLGGKADRIAADGDDQVGLGRHDLGGQSRHVAVAAIGPADVHGDVLAVDKADRS